MAQELLTPNKVAREIYTQLKELADPKKAESYQRFFKERVLVFGVDTPTLRRLARQRQKQLKPIWQADDAVKLCDLLIRKREIECKTIGLLILEGFAESFEPSLLSIAKGWLEKHCTNWANVDALCPATLTPLLAKYPKLISKIKTWTRSPNLWVRRAAAVALVQHARKGDLLDPAYEVAKSLLADQEDLIHKAVGWLLREAGRTDKSRLETFLITYGSDIPRTTVRYAIEHFPESQRKKLLKDTNM